LASAFLTDDFVLRYQPDICFVECTVADIGAATPQRYIAAAVEGITRKLLAKNCKVCFVHLYNSNTDEERKDNVISLYEKVIEHYHLPSVNISKTLAGYPSSDIVYDGIHTSAKGSQITAEYLFAAFEAICKQEPNQIDFSLPFQSVTVFPFQHTQIIIPATSMIDSSKPFKEKRFRGIIKYLQIHENNTLCYVPAEGSIVGVLIVADEESGVVLMESNSNSVYVQTHDQWCDRERIQAIILSEPVLAGNEFCISLSAREEADRGANGSANPMKKRGISLKIIGLMCAFQNEPETKSRLW
jgi:hypothetical protein